ncbi:DUF4153 domain-containing protein [Mucilaginibacter dorajii]|uniref:DUF4153 domain-containing protein n=1 Tax=Mucilaginibacter dorajii TaxID=692994 RepID=A0ABP7QFR2_9SPHI|nr:DUF4153 domain-containing protein [Mucilaginibacter dorajii]MCS3736061.1 hypothetical protein [Mucilaginibacter dorajii]
MRFPSIKTLAEGFLSTLKRYPFELLFALAGTIAGTIEVELKHLNRIDEGWLMRMAMTANLGLLLSLSATLFTQSRAMSKRNSFLIKLGAAIFASSLIFIIDPTAREADYIRFFLLSLAFHLLVAFAAFTGKGQVNGFWQFNKTLFLRFLTSVLYGVVLFLGIAAAIGATNFLFNFNFEWDTYVILWVWIVGMFTTTFFLAGVPINTAALDEDLSYPKALKIFTQYVLIPLSTIYVLILLAYEVKILIQWSLPKGLVSDLILSYAVFGILSLLLVYPIREHDGNKWLKTYARSFYFLMVPLLGLLFVAVGARVFKYGITEWRYFLIVLACWLLFISVYFLAFKKQNIKLIPISLCVLTLLSVYGPQSAFSVSMYSQRRIIIKFFEKHNALKQGLFAPIDSTHVDPKAASEAVAQLNYFVFKYDLSPLQPYIKKDLTLVNDSLGKLTGNPKSDIMISRYELREAKYEWIRKYLGLHHFDTWYNKAERVINQYEFIAANKIRNIKGYDFAFDPGYLTDSLSDKVDGIIMNSKTINNKVYILKINNETFRFDIAGLADGFLKNLKKMDRYKQESQEYDYQNTYKVPVEMLEIAKQGRGFDVLLVIESMTVSGEKKIENANPNYPNIGFAYYIKRK